MARRRTGAAPLVFIVALAAVMLGTVLVQGWSPALGLDLQGGVSVVYQATNEVPDDALDDTIEIIRSRVDDLGVAEPEIVRQGDAIVVSLPGVTDRERALEVIGRTAELRFRPVLTSQQYITQAQLDAATSTTTTAPGATTSTTVDPAAPSTTAAITDGSSTTTSTTVADEGAFAPAGLPPGLPGELASPAQEGTTTTATTATTVPVDPAATTTTAPVDPDAVPPPPGSEPLDFTGCALLGTTTTLEEDTPEATVILPGRDDGATQEEDDDDEPELCYQLGPVPTDGERSLTGTIVSGPEAQINAGEWGVSLNIKGDDLPLFNQVSAECFSRGPTCPTGQLAIVIDGEVQSAPSINEPSFTGQGLTISGNFDQSRADDLALVLRSGALPVELEAQTVQTVSATLGEESLRAGVIAGLIGVALVVLYLLVYYRVLAVVVVLGTLLWSALNYGIIAYLGETQSLALSLSGVTGIVISIGVTVDSYVVYFERLKDEVRSGRTFRSSVDRGFTRAFRTILAANVSSLIGAGLLYVLTVGPVRGFAFFLGLSTLLGLAVAWFFTRPLMGLLARSKFFTEHRFLGVARGLGASAPAAAATTGVAR